MKRLLYLLLSSFPLSVSAQTYTYDVNGDGNENIEDITCLTNHLVGKFNQGEHEYVEIGGLKWATMNIGVNFN